MRHTRFITAAAIALVVGAGLSGCDVAGPVKQASNAGGSTGSSSHDSAASSGAMKVKADFIRVVDGDTIVVKPTAQLPATNDYGDEHSFLVLGIDAPEMNKSTTGVPDCGAQLATDTLKDKLAGHSFVTLTFDPESDRTDRYGRSLAYVSTPTDADLGQEQVTSGLAEAWYPRSYHAPSRYRIYANDEQTAQERKTGSWGTCGSLGRD